jgi:trehalose/maltose transport system substrate-binding protein
MFKKSVSILLVLFLMAFVVVGCGGGDEKAKPEENQQAEKQDTSSDEKVVIKVGVGNVGKEFELTKKAAKMFQKDHPNVEVKLVDVPDSAQDRLGLYLQFLEAKSTKLDLYQIDVIWPGDLGEHFVDFYEYGGKEAAKKHFPANIENNTVDGRLVAMPWFTDAGLLYYRSDLLEKYGYDHPPKTWDELEKMAKKIQEGERAEGKSDFWGYVWQGEAYEGLTCDAVEWLDSMGAGTIVSPDKKITVNNDQAVKALNMAKSWIGDISPNGVTGMKEEDARKVFQGGNAAFMRNWPYAYSLGNSEDSVIKGKFDVVPVPAGDSGHGAAALGGWQLSVSKYSEHKKLAAEFALYLTGEKIQKMRAIEGGFNPTIKALYDDEEVLEANPFFGSLFDVFMNATPRPSTATAPNYNEVSTKFFKAVYSVLNGEEDAKTALEYLELDLKDITGFETGKPRK